MSFFMKFQDIFLDIYRCDDIINVFCKIFELIQIEINIILMSLFNIRFLYLRFLIIFNNLITKRKFFEFYNFNI